MNVGQIQAISCSGRGKRIESFHHEYQKRPLLGLSLGHEHVQNFRMLSASAGPVIEGMCGWMQKLGGARGGRRNWRRRWFVLCSNALLYYVSPSDPLPRGCLVLAGATVSFDVISPETIIFRWANNIYPSRVIRCDNVTDARRWFEAIKSTLRLSAMLRGGDANEDLPKTLAGIRPSGNNGEEPHSDDGEGDADMDSTQTSSVQVGHTFQSNPNADPTAPFFEGMSPFGQETPEERIQRIASLHLSLNTPPPQLSQLTCMLVMNPSPQHPDPSHFPCFVASSPVELERFYFFLTKAIFKANGADDDAKAEFFETCLNLEGGDADAMARVALALAVEQRDSQGLDAHFYPTDDVLALVREAVTIQPYLPIAHKTLGRMLLLAEMARKLMTDDEIFEEFGIAKEKQTMSVQSLLDDLVEEAIHHLRIAVGLYETRDLESILLLAEAYQRVSDMDAVVTALEVAQVISPHHPMIHSRLGAVLLNNGKVDQSLLHLEHATNIGKDGFDPTFPTDPEEDGGPATTLIYAIALYSQGHHKEAVEKLDSLLISTVETSPVNISARFLLGQYYADNNQPYLAIPELFLVHKLSKDDFHGHWIAPMSSDSLYLALAQCYLEIEREKFSLRDVNNLDDDDEEDVEYPRDQKGQLLPKPFGWTRRRLFGEAEDLLESILEVSPEDKSALMSLGLLYERKGEREVSILRKSKFSTMSDTTLGELNVPPIAAINTAYELYERVHLADQDKAWAEALLGMGRIQKCLGNLDKAKQHLNAALVLDPKLHDAQELLRRVDIALEQQKAEKARLSAASEKSSESISSFKGDQEDSSAKKSTKASKTSEERDLMAFDLSDDLGSLDDMSHTERKEHFFTTMREKKRAEEEREAAKKAALIASMTPEEKEQYEKDQKEKEKHEQKKDKMLLGQLGQFGSAKNNLLAQRGRGGARGRGARGRAA